MSAATTSFDDQVLQKRSSPRGNENFENAMSNSHQTKLFTPQEQQIEDKLNQLQDALQSFASDSARRLERIETGIHDILTRMGPALPVSTSDQTKTASTFMLPPSTSSDEQSDSSLMPPPSPRSSTIPQMFNFPSCSPPATPISPFQLPFQSPNDSGGGVVPGSGPAAPRPETVSRPWPPPAPLPNKRPAPPPLQVLPPPQTVKRNVTPPRIKITGLQSKWYTKRHYPDFSISLQAEDGSTFTNTQNWQVNVRLVAGNGLYVDHFLAAPALIFPINEGKATVSGLKFTAVTSRNGGYFQFEVSVNHPQDTGITPVRSQELRVLSERLRHEAKVTSVLELTPDDSILRVPGIGKKYARRLAGVGITKVRDLAAVNQDSRSKEGSLNLLDTVRRDRGALTETKLEQLLSDAREVVQRERLGGQDVELLEDGSCLSQLVKSASRAPHAQTPPSKRIKLERQSETENQECSLQHHEGSPTKFVAGDLSPTSIAKNEVEEMLNLAPVLDLSTDDYGILG